MATNHTPGPWKLYRSEFANSPYIIYVGDQAPSRGRYPLQGVNWIA